MTLKLVILKDGLTDFGIEMVRMMNELGMIIDVSHLSDKFYDAQSTQGPFIASHSNSEVFATIVGTI